MQLVDASYEGEWELPVIGVVGAPTAVLIRPDGHVAWVGDGTAVGLTDALTTWFGPATGQRLKARGARQWRRRASARVPKTATATTAPSAGP